jgi:hypothetical protein
VTKLKKSIWVGNVERTQEKKNSFEILEEQPERNRPLGRNRGRLNNIKNSSQRNRMQVTN